MLDNIEINNFRSIENLKIENFKNVNFFFGRANSAKTSVLEALYIFLKEDASAFKDISDSRFNLLDDDVIEGLFLDYNTSQEIRIENKAKNIIIKKSDDKKTQITKNEILNFDNFLVEDSLCGEDLYDLFKALSLAYDSGMVVGLIKRTGLLNA